MNNPRIMAAMNELNKINWDEYLSPSLSSPPPLATPPLPRSLPPSSISSKSVSPSISKSQPAPIFSEGSDSETMTGKYSGYIFDDPLPPMEQKEEIVLNPVQNLQSEVKSNQQQESPEQSIEQIPEGRYVNDDESNDSEEPVLSGEVEDEFGLDSPDSLSTKESINDQEILAHNNAIKNKDLLHESFLLENRLSQDRLLHEIDQNGSVNRENGTNNTYGSVEGDTKSVTFADEDSIYEYDRLDVDGAPPTFAYDSYPDMDPNSIPSSDREAVTRRYMVQAVREDEEAHQSHPQSHPIHYLPDDMYPTHSSELFNEKDKEKEIARQRFEQLYASSPEFRAAILSSPNFNAVIEKTKVKKELHSNPINKKAKKPPILPSQTQDKKFTQKNSRTKERLKSSAKPFAESSVADSLDPMFDLEPIETLKKNRPNSALPRISTAKSNDLKQNHIKKKIQTESQSGPALMSKTLPTPANEHIIRLAQDVHRATPSLEFAPPPPKLSTDCPALPFDDVMKLAELNTTGDSYCILLNPGEEKIRLKARYYANLSDWEFSNRLDFFGLHFFRSELLHSSLESTFNEKYLQSTVAPSSGHLSPAFTETQQILSKKKLLLSHDDATDYLFANHTKDIRKNFPHLFQFNGFMKETYTGFVCLVFDMKMQLLGTFEPHRQDSFPGITICPPFLNHHKKKKRYQETHLANLLEIDMERLPAETFAIVPVFYDDCPFGARFPEITFQLDVSALDPINRDDHHSFRRAGVYWIPGGIEQDSEVTPIHDLFDVEKDVEIPLVTPPPAHVSSEELDPGWSHVESYFCNRETKILETNELEGPPIIDPDHLETQSKMVILGPQQSFVPFAFFRVLDSKKNSNVHFVPNGQNSSNELSESDKINRLPNRQWGIKSIQQSFNGVMFHTITRGIIETLKSKHILPYHVINIEHCVRCDLHSMTTWHVPGSYEKWFADLKKMLRKSLPPALIYSNKFTNTESHPPRLGSFELSVRPYSSDCTQLIFSKLSSRTLPPTETILRDLAVLLLPETIRFEGSHILELHIFDSYSKKPLKGATISLYKISVGMSLQATDLERDYLQEKSPHDHNHQEEDDEEFDEGWTNIKKNRHKMRIENAKRNTEVNQARATMFKQSYSHKQKDQQPADYTTKLITSADTTHAHFRHSSVYYKVRSWKAEDIALWFKSFSIGKDVVDRAFADGMIDGPSFVALANQQAFEKWGVRNKIKLERMNKSLEEILSTSTNQLTDPFTENVSSQKNYDPFTDTYPTLSKQTQIKQCEPGRPKPAYLKDDLNLKLISTKKTDSRGLGFISVDVAGSFFLRIESSSSRPYCSNAFQISSRGHTGFCASMTPRIGIAMITITLSDDPSENNLPSGLLISMMNLSSGKRHIAFAKRTSVKVVKSPQSPASTSDDIFPSRPQSSRFAPPKRALTMDTPQKKPGTFVRQASVGAILLNEMTNSWKGGSVIAQSKQISPSPEQETRVLETIIWLPVGKYFSEVDGQVFEVKEDESGKLASNVNYWNPSEGVDTEIVGNEPVSLQYSVHAAQKCHRRILLGSIRAFQKIYRRYKKDFLTTNLWAYLALKKHLRKYLLYIRGILTARKSTLIGKTFRMFSERKRYRYMMACVVTIQCALRRYRSRKRVRVIRRSRILIIRLLSNYVVRRCEIRNRGALRIQCRARQFLAKVHFNRRLVNRRIFRALKRWLKYNEKRKYSLFQREYQEYERCLMEFEEQYQREYLRQYQAEEMRKIRVKAQQVERRRNYCATKIQTYFRGYRQRMLFKVALKGVIRLQKIFRLRRYEDRLKQSIPVKYVIGYPSLAKNPKLLGATKLLQGLELAPKPISSQPPPSPPRFIDQILIKLLTPPTIKIQSVVRMFLVRMKYIRKRRESENCEDQATFPPLYRYLVPVIPTSMSENDEISQESEKIWDNGAQNFLHDLGYIRNDEIANHSTNSNVEPEETIENDDFGEEPVEPVQVDDYLRQVVPRDRRITRLDDQKSNRAAVKIQSVVRRHLAKKAFAVRLGMYRQISKSLHSPSSPYDSPKKSKKLIQAMKTQSNVIKSIQSFSFGDTIKKSLSRTLSSTSEITGSIGKPLLRTISKELVHAVDSSVKSVKLASDTVVNKYNERTEQLKENNEKIKLELIRKDRIQKNEFCIEDAVFNIRGRPVDVPRMNRQWYVGAFPQIDEYEIDVETLQNDMLSGHDLEQAYEMSQDRIIGEAVRTPPLSPLSKETFESINFNLHFADLQRYTRLLVVVFIETSEETDGRIRTDALPSHIAIPTLKQSQSAEQTPKFLPLFYGSCQLNGGLAYPPTGGRLTFILQPNPNQAIIFSKSQAKRLSKLKEIEMQGTLVPIAVPSSKFLSSLCDPKASVPSYPSELLDAFLFEKNEIHTKEFYGAAICMLRFDSRNLISTRHRGVPNGVTEFSLEGKSLGRVIDYREDIGTVTSMSGGKHHFITCGSTGAFCVYAPPEVVRGSESIAIDQSTDFPSRNPFDCVRFQALHRWPIVMSCSIHRAGIDFFFTIDRQNNIGVIVMENRICVRSYLNEVFVQSRINCCQATRDRLYLGLQSGHLVTINLYPILSGQIDNAKKLVEFVTDREIIFPEDCGISAMGVMSAADYFGMLNDDITHNLSGSSNPNDGDPKFTSTNVRIKPKQKLVGMRLKPQKSVSSNETSYQKNSRLKPGRPLEGHILIIAGGDKNPIMKILRPLHPKPSAGSAFYQIGQLPGHGKATSQIVTDAAGRFIVSCSQGSRSIAVWNGITFNCERTYENVNVGFMGVGENSLIVCSFKAPFLTIYREPELPPVEKKVSRKQVKSSYSNVSEISQFENEDSGTDLSPDGRPEIAMVRTSVWCLTTVTGGKIIPQKSLAPASQFLGECGRRVVEDWRVFYNRSIKKMIKSPPPVPSSSIKKTVSMGSLPPIHETSRAKRRELQKLASGSYSPLKARREENNDSILDTESQITFDQIPAMQQSITDQSQSQYDWQTGYDYRYGCYYDENGYAYNYDQNGNYFYYDASWYEQFKPLPVSSPAEVVPKQVDPERSSLTSDSYITEGVGFNSQEELNGGSFLQIGENSFQSPSQFPFSPEPDLVTPSGMMNYPISPIESDQTKSPLLVHHQLSTSPVRYPQSKDFSSFSFNDDDAKSPKLSSKLGQNSEEYDRYGKYIGSDLDKYDIDRPIKSQKGLSVRDQSDHLTGESGTSLPLTVISLKRRHMHMSDSDEDEEEKMESIYRQTNRVSNQTEKSHPPKGRKDSYDDYDGDNYEKGGQFEDQNYSVRSHGSDDSEIISIREERKKIIKEREKLIQRGLLHHLADDSSDDD